MQNISEIFLATIIKNWYFLLEKILQWNKLSVLTKNQFKYIFTFPVFWELHLLELCLQDVITATWSSFVDMLINLYYFILFFFFFKEGATEDSVSQAGSTIWPLTWPWAAALLCQPLQCAWMSGLGGWGKAVTHQLPVFYKCLYCILSQVESIIKNIYFPFYT